MFFLDIFSTKCKIRCNRPSDTWWSIGRCDQPIEYWPPLVYFGV